MRWRLALLAITVAAACTTRVGPQTAPIVRSVEIRGNEEVGEREIVGGLATRPPTGWLARTYFAFDELSLRLDVERIERYYQSRGYFAARVDRAAIARGQDVVDVILDVVEGAPTRITERRIDGLPPEVSEANVDARIAALRPGAIFRHDEYQRGKQLLRVWLIGRGFAHARVGGRVLVDRDQRTARVFFEVDPGPLTRFGEVRVEGLSRVPESAVRNRVAWQPGERFDPAKLERTQARLYALGHFAAVRMDYARLDRPEVSDVTIRVTEGTRHELRLGGGAAADQTFWEVRARAAYSVIGFVDPLLTLRIEVRPAYRLLRGDLGVRGFGGEARVGISREDFLLPRLELVASVDYGQTELEAYSVRGPSGRVGLRRPLLTDRLIVGAGWQLGYLNIFRVAPAIAQQPLEAEELGFVDPYRLGFFDQIVSYDQRDRLLDPRRGYYAELRLEEGGGFAGGRFGYLRATGDLRGYRPLATRLVLAGRVTYGQRLTGELPVTQRYFGGGASSHRGFAQRHLSPVLVDAAGETARIGGEQLLETSAEARWQAFQLRGQWLSLALFVDGGDVTRELDIDVTDLHWALGAGLRYQTIVGPVRFDVARRLNRTGPGEPAPGDRWAFHISIGEAF